MKGDFTRFTFKPEKGYSSVRMQQGRVQLDADWNEHVEIRNHLERSESIDVIGASGAPRENGGFKLSVEGSDLAISRGRIYVDGILCENDADNRACEYEEPRTCPSVLFSGQPHRPSQTLPSATGLYLFYLDVWERHVTAVEDPNIRETALGGPDTATRVKTIWQVRYLPVDDQNDQNVALTCWDVPDEWAQLLGETKGRMAAQAEADEGTQDPCIVAAEAGYRRLENQLYRVEIHRPSGTLDSFGMESPPTIKWSRDNGMVLTRLIGIDIDNDKLLTVADPGKDSNLRFASGNWVEITDDSMVLEGEPGTMVRLLSVEGNVLEIESWPSGAPPVLDMATATVRRWDHKGKDDQDLSASGGALPIVADTWIDLEDGVQVRFESGGTYNCGDYWLIPARVVGGDVEWPKDEISGEPLYRQPRGINHHYCRLALVSVNVPDSLTPPLEVVCDARPLFPALTEPDLYYVSGDGQEAMPDTELPQPLEVGVVNCNRPVEGAWTKFEIAKGGGYLIPDPGATVVVPLLEHVGGDFDGELMAFIMPTNHEGRASCRWHLQDLPPETDQPDQQVVATLLKLPVDSAENELDVPVVFGASFGVAWQDRYGGTNFPDGPHPGLQVNTVEGALDQLRENTALHYLGGDGQEARRGEQLPQPLEVRVANGQWPRPNATVRFEVSVDSLGADGMLDDGDGGTGTSLEVNTDGDGRAWVFWTPDANGRDSQRVTATLIDPLQPTNGSQGFIHFNANLSIADEVSYDGSDFPDSDHPGLQVDTVEDALDQLRENTALHYVGGDGQETRRGEQLPQPLEVRVANGQWPRAGATVRFEVLVDSLGADGTLEDPDGGTGTSLDVTTDGDGRAWILWTPDANGRDSQRVRASLIDPLQPTNGSQGFIHFNASLSVAAEVSYDGSAFPDDQHPELRVDTVEDALDQLRENVALHHVGGDGQEAMPGERLPKPLQVRVANGQWVKPGAQVRFSIVADNGNGELIDDTGARGRTLTVQTGPDGVAQCDWQLDGTPASQQVEATLLGAAGPAPVPVVPTPVTPGPGGPGGGGRPIEVGPTPGGPGGGGRPIEVGPTPGGPGGGGRPIEGGPTPAVPVSAVGPVGGPVRFNASTSIAGEVNYDSSACPDLAGINTVQSAIDQLCRLIPQDEPGIPIGAVVTAADGQPLLNDADLEVARLIGSPGKSGIVVTCEGDIAEEAFLQNHLEPIGGPIPAKPNCIVTVDFPVPSLLQPDPSWGISSVVGFQPLILAAQVIAKEKQIFWQPAAATSAWLAQVFNVLSQKEITDRLLVHFTLKGNFIWAPNEAKVNLDGDVFGKPDVTRVDLQLPSGDGRRGGDFEMWFWLVGKATRQPGEPIPTPIDPIPTPIEPVPPPIGPAPPPIGPAPPPVGPAPPPIGPAPPPVGPIAQPERLNLNTATAEELEALPGVGPEIARAIVAVRPFTNVNELLIVDGIGFATLERIKPLVRI